MMIFKQDNHKVSNLEFVSSTNLHFHTFPWQKRIDLQLDLSVRSVSLVVLAPNVAEGLTIVSCLR